MVEQEPTNQEPEYDGCEDGHEWVIELHNNGVGYYWYECECIHCDADITQEEFEALMEGE